MCFIGLYFYDKVVFNGDLDMFYSLFFVRFYDDKFFFSNLFIIILDIFIMCELLIFGGRENLEGVGDSVGFLVVVKYEQIIVV